MYFLYQKTLETYESCNYGISNLLVNVHDNYNLYFS